MYFEIRKPSVSLIAAVAKNGVIGGFGGGIPWHLPRDIEHFRYYTAHHHNLVGRRTYEEMIGWFETQIPIVMTHQDDYFIEGGFVVKSVPDAIRIAQMAGDDNLVVLGGAEIFELALPYADRLVMTYVDADIPGSVVFPDPAPHGPWLEVARKRYEPDDQHAYAIDFVVFLKAEESEVGLLAR